MQKLKYFFIFILSFLSVTVWSQEFHGVVLSEDATPIVGASVSFNTSSSQPVLTDSLGRFVIPLIGNHIEVKVSAFGYKKYAKHLSTDTILGRVLIFPLQHVAIDEVVVTSTIKPHMQKQGSKWIIDNISSSLYAKGNNAFTFLRFVPLVEVPVSKGDIKVVYAGMKPATLLVNGKRKSVPMDVYLKNIRASDIDKIEVVPVPMGEYKVSDGPIVNIVLKKRADEGVKYHLYVDDSQSRINDQRGDFNLSYTSQKTDLSFGVYAANVKNISKMDASYRYYDLLRSNEIHTDEKYQRLSFAPYFNLDFNLNKKHVVGIRTAVSIGNYNKRTTAFTTYGQMHSSIPDSSQVSVYRSHAPLRLTTITLNFNYTWHTDNKGSLFFADIDYFSNRPKTSMDYLIERDDEPLQKSFDSFSRNYGYSIWMRYNHVFNSSVRLNSALIYLYGHTHADNALIVSPDYRDVMDYSDRTFMAYSTFSKSFGSKFYMRLMLNLKVYDANGKQRTTNEKIAQHVVTFLPQLSFDYNISDNHALSLSFNVSQSLPRFQELNPLIVYTTPTTYSKGNPQLKPSKLYYANFYYRFFRNFSFVATMMYTHDNRTDYTISDGKGNTVNTYLNGMKSLSGFVFLGGSQSLFHDYLYLTADVSRIQEWNENTHIHSKWQGGYFNAKITANVTLSKKHVWSLYARYDYLSKNKGGIKGVNPEIHSLNLSLTKGLKYGSLSLDVSPSLQRHRKSSYETLNYGFTQISRLPLGRVSINYSVTFGNRRVRGVVGRQSELKNRIQ